MPKKAQAGLGRGFFDIYEDNLPTEHSNSQTSLRISSVEPRSDQPRKQFDRESLESLSDSIASLGVLQPIIVRENPLSAGHYEIIAGERRWRAAKMAGLNEIPAIILDSDELKTAQISLIENVQRENLNPVEEAFAYKMLIERFGLTQEELSKQVNRNRSTIANMMRLLDLPTDVQELLKSGQLSTGHARALLGLSDQSLSTDLANRIIDRDLSVREVERLVKTLNEKSNEATAVSTTDSITIKLRKSYMKDLESKAQERIGHRVRINESPKKKVIEISFSDDDDLESILKSIFGSEFFDAITK